MSSVLEVKSLELLVAIAEEGTVTRAARRLHLTQSALSHRLISLQERLGVALFVRRGRGLALTPIGERLLMRARALLAEMNELEARCHEPPPTPTELRVASQCFTCYHWLPVLLPHFELRHPDMRVSLVVESTRRAMQALEQDLVDVAICSESRQDEEFCSRLLFDDELVLALAPQHSLAHQESVAYADLADQKLYLHPPAPADKLWFREALGLGSCERGPSSIRYVPVTDSIIGLVARNHGTALLTRRSTAQASAEGRIVVRSFAPRPLNRNLYAVSRRHPARTLPIDDFVMSLRVAAGAG